MTDHDAGEDALAGIDLHVWRVPPPRAVDPPSLLVRALSPAVPTAKRSRLAWIVAALVLVNAVIAALVLVLVRPQESATVVRPAGGGSVDARVSELLQRLEKQQRELEQQQLEIERKLAEIQELRELVDALTKKVGQRERTVSPPRPPVRRLPRVDPLPEEALEDPLSTPSCDEVACVLGTAPATCCVKFRRPRAPTAKDPAHLPTSLERSAISIAIASVRPEIVACAARSTKTGTVKLHVRVGPDGRVTSVTVDQTPDDALGGCVASAVRRAVFEPTLNGGSFSYPFIF